LYFAQDDWERFWFSKHKRKKWPEMIFSSNLVGKEYQVPGKVGKHMRRIGG